MMTSYPVNDYRGYLAHASNRRQVSMADWEEHKNSKYTSRVWRGDHWQYYYGNEPKGSDTTAADKRDAREEKANQYHQTHMTPGQKRVTAEQAGRNVGTSIARGVDKATGAVSGAYNTASSAIGGTIDWISDFGDQQGKVYETEERFENGETVEVPLDGTNGTQKKYANTIAGNTVRIANDIASWAAQAFNDVKSWITGTAQNIGSWFNDRKTDLVNKYREVQSFVNGIASGLKTSPQITAVLGTIQQGFSAFTSAIGGAMRTVGSAIGTAANAVGSFASDIFNGFADLLGLNDQINQALSGKSGGGLNRGITATQLDWSK